MKTNKKINKKKVLSIVIGVGLIVSSSIFVYGKNMKSTAIEMEPIVIDLGTVDIGYGEVPDEIELSEEDYEKIIKILDEQLIQEVRETHNLSDSDEVVIEGDKLLVNGEILLTIETGEIKPVE